MKSRTYKEDDRYYAIVVLRSGHEVYLGPYPNRSAARRAATRRGKSK